MRYASANLSFAKASLCGHFEVVQLLLKLELYANGQLSKANVAV